MRNQELGLCGMIGICLCLFPHSHLISSSSSLSIIAISASYRSSNEPASFLSQGLCAFCSFCLECYFPTLNLLDSDSLFRFQFNCSFLREVFTYSNSLSYSPTYYFLYTVSVFPPKSLPQFVILHITLLVPYFSPF